MHLTENQLRKKINTILKELLGAKSKKGGTQLQRALGHGGDGYYGDGSGYGSDGYYGGYDDDDAAYDIGVALDTDDDGLDD
tara:strand:+ start:10665 stop:10907 length:243 start_codon:yes stop_codon:yes gene_type:complete